MKTPVKSAVRIRPFITDDQPHDVMCVNALPHLNQVALSGQKCFTVDYALPVSYTQNQVFEVSVQPMVKYILQGFDISVVAYGQKNSGKTYTIFGPGLHCAFSETDYGIIPRTTREIFNQLMHGTRKYKVTVTFIEIFGESIRDLLGTSQVKPVLGMKHGRTSVCHVNEIECHNVSEVFNCLHVGMSSRQAPEQTMNTRSSCGHSVFTLFLEQEWIINGVQQLVCSQAQFTDLAGSNSLFLNIAVESSGTQRLHYDNGLLALENMIVALSDPSSEHASIFYMNTVLTRILKNSFGGSAYTLLICCISPASLDISKTVHSLQLAAQGRNVRNFLAMTVCNNSSTFCVNSPEREISEEKLNVSEKQTTDVFGLSFAASQWLKLVASAERLFTELTSSAILSTKMKDQIEHWLCLKQECEECIECDIVMDDSVDESRVLYRIDELTEPEERNSSVVDGPQTECSENGSSVVMCDFLLDSNVGFSEFPEKLDGCIKLFKNHVDNSVKLVEENFVLENSDVRDSNLNGDSVVNNSLEDLQNTNDTISDQQVSVSHTLFPSKQLSTRRNSICHGANSPEVLVPKLQLSDDLEKIDEKDVEMETEQVKEILLKSSSIIYQSADLQNMLKELKLLAEESGDKPTKCQQMITELEESLNEIEKLKQIIWKKQQLVGNLIKNELTDSLKHFHHDNNKLVSEYHNMKSNVVLTETSVHIIDTDNRNQKNLQKAGRELKKLSHCTEKFPDEVNTTKTTGYAKIISESETNHEMNELRMELLKEVKHVHELEKEIAADKQKIEDLQEKYHLHEKQMAKNHPLKQLQWIYDEELRLMNIQKSTQRLQEELVKQQSLLEKREAFLKEKLCQEKLKTKNEIDMNGRLSHLDHVLKDKSDNLEVAEDRDEKEALRHEIQNLRKTRDCLVEQLFSLDEKFQKDKVLTTVEERKLLECDEAIEAIDAAIEYKNELICGRRDDGLVGLGDGENEELLLARLMKLSPVEIRSLLCKYFKKVIDLRESGRKMEMQLAELDMQAEAHAWKIQTLSSALQQAQVEAEKQILTLQEEHDEELHVMLRRFTGDTSSSSDLEAPVHHYPSDIVTNLAKYKRENKNLRRRIQEMENILHMSNIAGEPSPVTIPHQNLKQLQGALAPYTTKVTRQKNKLIIQQTNKSSQKR